MYILSDDVRFSMCAVELCAPYSRKICYNSVTTLVAEVGADKTEFVFDVRSVRK